MKLKCVQNKVERRLLPDSEYSLTVGKSYPVQVVNSRGLITEHSDDLKFLVFNDEGEWELYDLYLFEPEAQ